MATRVEASGVDRRRVVALAVAAAMVITGTTLFMVLRGGDVADTRSRVATTTSSTTTSTSAPEPGPPTGPVAPLTGLPVREADASLLRRPALVAKIDNHPKALPQWGLVDADVVIEVQVEGISRFLAAFHSREVGSVGPVRSARTSDPDLLALFGRPLTAWSGANPATSAQMRSLSWIQDISVDRLPGVYTRDRGRRAPHNLVLDGGAAFEAAEEPVEGPTALFGYRAEGDAPVGEPVAGMSVSIGFSSAQYVWDGERGGWLRWSDGEPLTGTTGGGGERFHVAPQNVVVLETEYVSSDADHRSPEAVTLGSGRAWVFSAGRRVEGRWHRAERTAPWQLTSQDGAPVQLSPGSTWVELTATGDEPTSLTGEQAERRRDP